MQLIFFFLVAFYIFHENSVKTFLIMFINNYPKGTHYHNPYYVHEGLKAIWVK